MDALNGVSRHSLWGVDAALLFGHCSHWEVSRRRHFIGPWLRVLSTQFLLNDFLNSLFRRIHLSLLSLCRLSKVKALLARFL